MTNYKLNEEKMYADIADGIAIIINIDTGVYYGMNKLGTVIFENMIKGVSAEKILDKLKMWNDKAEESFNEYIKFVTENGIMTEDTEIKEDIDVNIDETIAEEEEFIPKAEEYLDSQELLQTDSIYEVKEKGWMPNNHHCIRQ